ncbi:MAG: LacI family DNA-binding transcriptional regulator [Ruminococcus sp.]
MATKVSIQDVAMRAGVSAASVSYVINNVDKVSAETRARILKAIDELHYKPNMVARCLSKGYSKLLGIAMPQIQSDDGERESNPFFNEFIDAVENSVKDKEYDVVISSFDSKKEYSDWVQRRRLDALIILGSFPDSILNEIRESGVPVVLTDDYEKYPDNFHCVKIDDEYGGYIAAKHLLELGHKDIGFVSGDISQSDVNRSRYEGFLRAHREFGITHNSNLIFEEDVSFNGGYRVTQKIIETNATAIFACADIMCVGIIKACYDRGIVIPRDLSVVGFDDIQYAKYTTPALTTVRQDIAKRGRMSVSLVIEDLENNSLTSDSMIIKPELVVRDSTAKPL